MDARTEFLINAELDGDLDQAEMDELRQRLAASPEAVKFRDRIRMTHDMLGTLRPEEPPAALHERITSAVSLPAPAETAPVAGANPRLHGVVRYGLAASVGLAAGLLLNGLLPAFDTVDVNQVRGTMAPANKLPQMQVEHALVRSRASLDHVGEFSQLSLDLNSQQAIDVIISLTGSGLQFAGLAPAREPLSELRVGNDMIRMRSQGRRQVQILFARDADFESASRPPLQIEYLHNDSLIERRVIGAD